MKFGRIALWTVVACAWAAPHSVLAADLSEPPLAPVMPAAAPVYNWSGAYLGGQVGYGWGRSSTGPISLYNDPLAPPAATLPGFAFSSNGILGGVEAGYGWQASKMYFGVEADVSAANIAGSYVDTINNFSVDSTLQWLSTARLRVGIPLDRVLLFASGGLAVGGVRGELHDVYSGPGTINSSSSSTGWGWTAGAGAAVALSSRWSIKAEYLYVDLGSQKYSFNEPTGPDWALITDKAKTTASIGRVALDYRF